jgi:hypothetical protein
MNELSIVILIVAGLIGVTFVRQLPFYTIFRGIVVILNLMNLVITGINLWQARAQDKRFLYAGYLGLIQLMPYIFEPEMLRVASALRRSRSGGMEFYRFHGDKSAYARDRANPPSHHNPSGPDVEVVPIR